MNNKLLLACLIVFIQLLAFGLVSVALEKPVGSVSGKIAFEKAGFHLQFSGLENQKSYVTATGPRGTLTDERGVWVKPDGTFRIDHLPKGEYSLKVHSNGYGTEYRSGIFIDDGIITELATPVTLDILHPSVSIGSNKKVFTSQEIPYFWINCSGANQATVKLYKTDILKFLHETLVSHHKNNKRPAAKTDGEPSDEGSAAINFGNNLSLYKGYGTKEPNLFPNQNPYQILSRKIESNEDDWANVQFKLKKPLPYGDYVGLAEVRNLAGEKEWDIFWFNVSDLGLVIKHDAQKLIAQAINLNTLKPIENAVIQIVSAQNQAEMLSVKTGSDGTVATALLASLQSVNNLITVGSSAESRTYGGLWFSEDTNNSNHYRTYFYTERPIYRLGQTVYFKGITRSLDGDGFHTPPAGLLVDTIIEDPNNNKIWQGKFRTNNYGSFSGTFDVPAEGNTGAYQLTFTFADGSKQYGSFEVAQYRKPEYEVVVSPTQPRVIAGNKITAKIKATYYFGSPVANARIKYSVYASNDLAGRYRLMPRPGFYSYFDDWSDDESENGGYGTYAGGGDYVSDGVAQTDANGEAFIEVQTKKCTAPSSGPYDDNYADKIYKIDAEVTDLSRMSVVSSGNCAVSAGNFTVFVQPNDYVVRAGHSVSANVSVIDYDKKAVVNQAVTVKLARWIWDQKNNQFQGLEIESQQSVKTDNTGKATVVFEAKNSLPSDSYFVIAQANDSAGDQIYDQASVWIASKYNPYVCNEEAAKKETLQIKLDKFAYQNGDTAQAVITAPLTGKEGVKALVAVEGTKIHKWWTVDLNATATMIELPVLANYAPNVFITVSVIGLDHRFYSQSRIIRVSPKKHFLNLAVNTDKTQYSPGETVHYTIKATDSAGQAVPNSELSFGLVDESIYAIRSEAAPDIQKFFYDKRANWVVTTCTFAEEYSGGPDKLDSQVGKVRKDFRDTAVWLPNLKTDRNGIAIANVTLPDNLTTWRATIRGITTGTDIGSTINKVISTQDLIVRLALPRFFTLGDETFINAVVHNYTKKVQSIRLNLSTTPQFSVGEKLEQILTVLPDKAQRFSWPVKVTGSGEANVLIRAVGKGATDAMESKVNILTLGVPVFKVNCGELLDNPSAAIINQGKITAVCPGTFKHVLSICASSIGPVLGNFDKLIDYPYGCTEQTMSRLMPSVIAMKLHKRLGLPIDKKQSARFTEVYKQSMAKLKDYQHEDGGWGWWQVGDSDLYLTSLVLDGYYQLKDVGYQTDAAQIKRGTSWLVKASEDLLKQLTDPKIVYSSEYDPYYARRESSIDLAKAVYTLGLYKIKPPLKVKQWLVSQIPNLPPEALSYLTLTLKSSEDIRFGRSYKRLLDLANRKDNFVEWDHTKELLRRMDIPDRVYDYTYRFTGIETTALALRTILVVDPADKAQIESIKQWLLVERDNNGWANTKTTAQVFIALLEEQLSFGHTLTTNEGLTINLADNLLKQLNFDSQNQFADEEKISLPQLEKGQTVNLNKIGTGRIYYNSLLTYTRLFQPGENIAGAGSPQGLSLERSFYRLSPTATTSDGKIHFRSEKITDNVIHSGETVLMKVTVDSPISLPYVILEASLPSGAEVVGDQSKENLIESNKDSNMEGDWVAPWWTHQDILDDRIVFFGTQLPQGKSTFTALLRFEMPGKYQINPIKLEGMYAKNVRAYSSLDTVCVTE